MGRYGIKRNIQGGNIKIITEKENIYTVLK